MKIKIGDTTYDCTDIPVCLYLSEEERLQISNMEPKLGERRYAIVPDSWSREELEGWWDDCE